MDSSVKLIIHRGSTIFDSLIVTSDTAIRYEQNVANEKFRQIRDTVNADSEQRRQISYVCLNKAGYNAYLVSVYIATITLSDVYRRSALRQLLQFIEKSMNIKSLNKILIRLRTPRKQFLDYQWCYRLTIMALERREIDYAMSWLSTLGGAFSALGDEFQYCAEMAGKISARQFQLALQLGDPLLIARCKLYAALSMIQRNHYSTPKEIVRSVYKLAIEYKDIRLQNMCQGIWAKLRYCYLQRKERKKK